MGILNFLKDNTLDSQIAKYEDLSLKKPQDPSIKNSLGDLYLKKMSIEKAAQNYREAIDLFLSQRMKEKAVAVIKKSLSHDLLDSASMDRIGDSLVDKGFTDDAVSLYIQLAKMKLNTNRPLANDIFRKILQIAPENTEAIAFFQKGKKASEFIEDVKQPVETPSAEESTGVDEGIVIIPEYTPAQANAHVEVPYEDADAHAKHDVSHQRETRKSPMVKKEEDVVSSKIKDKFIVVAKEKSHLENIILQQNDVIKKLEQDKAEISVSLKNFAEDNNKLKEKLLDFDLLRNMEISELRKKIETLIRENKKLLHDKDLILTNLDRDQKNISLLDSRNADTFLQERQQLEDTISRLKAELEQSQALSADIRQSAGEGSAISKGLYADDQTLLKQNEALQQAIDEMQAIMAARENEEKAQWLRYQALQDEREKFKAEAASLTSRLSELGQEKSLLEEELSRKILSYETQTAELKTDIDELTSSMEGKIKTIDELNEKISQLSVIAEKQDDASSSETPLLQAKVSELSASLDLKMEEISFYSKEMSDLNGKIAALSKEIIDKDQRAAKLSEDYRQEKAGLLAKVGDLENANNRLADENRRLLSESSDVQTRIAEYTRFCEEADSARQRLDEELLTLKQDFEQKENAMKEQMSQLQDALKKKDELLDARTDIYTKAEQDLSAVRSEHESALRNLEGENSKLLEEIAEAKARISEYTKFCEEADRQRQNLEEALSGLRQEGLKEEIASLEMKNRELQEMLELRVHEVSETALKLENVAGSREQTETDLASALGRAAEAEQERALLKAELHSLNEKIASLEMEKKSSEHGFKEKIASLQEMTDDIQLHHFMDMLEIKDNEIAEMTVKLKDALDRLERSEAALSASGNGATENERDALKAELQVLTEELSSLKDEKRNSEVELSNKIADYETEISRLKSVMEEQKASLTESGAKEDIAKMQEQFLMNEQAMTERINSLVSELAHKEAMLSEKSKDYEKEKETNRMRLAEFELINQQLEEKLSIQSELEYIRDKVSENTRLYEASDKERKELEEQLSEALQKILDLENQYSSMLAIRPSQEMVAELEKKNKAEVYELAEKLAIFQSDIDELKNKVYEKEKALELVSEEKTALLQSISDMQAEHERTIRDQAQELLRLEHQASTASVRVNDLETNLANSLQESIALRKKLQEKTADAGYAPAPGQASLGIEPAVAEKPSARDRDKTVFPEKRRWLPYLSYSLIVVLVIAAAGGLMKQYKADTPAPKVEQPAVAAPLSYKELFDSLTKEKASEDVKFQATMITESLLQKENGGKDLPKYNFQGYYYFKVNIYSLKGALSRDFLSNPAASLVLSEGKRTIAPASDVKIDEIRTIYRKEEPVSAAFICGFSREGGTANNKNIELILNRAGREIRLSWDSRMLKAEKTTP